MQFVVSVAMHSDQVYRPPPLGGLRTSRHPLVVPMGIPFSRPAASGTVSL